jgi:hypothetical protein
MPYSTTASQPHKATTTTVRANCLDFTWWSSTSVVRIGLCFHIFATTASVFHPGIFVGLHANTRHPANQDDRTDPNPQHASWCMCCVATPPANRPDATVCDVLSGPVTIRVRQLRVPYHLLSGSKRSARTTRSSYLARTHGRWERFRKISKTSRLAETCLL